jgi:hypothetical protein
MRLLPHLFMKPAPFYVAQDDASSGAVLDGYAPCYAANLAVLSFVKRDDKDELQ